MLVQDHLGERPNRVGLTHLVRKGQGQLDLVGDSLSISTALDGSAEEGGTGPEGRASKAEGAHCAMDGGAKAECIPLEGCVAKVEVGAGCSLVPGHVAATRPAHT